MRTNISMNVVFVIMLNKKVINGLQKHSVNFVAANRIIKPIRMRLGATKWLTSSHRLHILRQWSGKMQLFCGDGMTEGQFPGMECLTCY